MKAVAVIKNGLTVHVEVFNEYFTVCGGIWVNAYISAEKMYCKYYEAGYSDGSDMLLRMVRDEGTEKGMLKLTLSDPQTESKAMNA